MSSEPTPRILVVLLGLVGDTLMRVPLVRALRERHPDARLVAVCDPPVASILALNPLFDEVIPFDRRGTGYLDQLRFYWALRRHRFDLAVDMYFGARTPILVWCAGARRRLGLGNYWYGNVLLTDVVPSPFPPGHMVDRHLPLLTPLGITSLRRIWECPVGAAEDRALARELDAAGIDPLPGEEDVVVAVGAGDVTKRLDEGVLEGVVQGFAEGARGRPRRVLLVADAQEPELTARWRGRPGVVALPPLSLPDVAALFARAGLVVVPDSGLMHVALATAPRMLTFFQSTHPHWHDAIRPAYRLLYREVCPVQPCDTRLKHTCRHECRLSLRAEDLLDAAGELLAAPAWDGTWPENRVTLAAVQQAAVTASAAAGGYRAQR